MNMEEALTLADRQFYDWVTQLEDSAKNIALTSVGGIGSYSDNKFNRVVLSAGQADLLRQKGVDFGQPPTNREVKGILMHSRRLEESQNSTVDHLDDTYLFEENRDPHQNLCYLSLIDTDLMLIEGHGILDMINARLEKKII